MHQTSTRILETDKLQSYKLEKDHSTNIEIFKEIIPHRDHYSSMALCDSILEYWISLLVMYVIIKIGSQLA